MHSLMVSVSARFRSTRVPEVLILSILNTTTMMNELNTDFTNEPTNEAKHETKLETKVAATDTNVAPTFAPEYQLDEFEVRVLGVLIEKSFLTPDNFPLSLNSLVNGCNQLTAREPVMALGEEVVMLALESLSQQKLAQERQQAGGRVPKYEHHMSFRISLDKPLQAVLCVLLLRGAQTVGEIRARTERMVAFSDAHAVEDVLTQLSEKFPPMVARLPRAPGAKEVRYIHLMSGSDGQSQAESAQAFSGVGGLVASSPRSDRIEVLEHQVADLQQQLNNLQLDFASFKQKFE